MFLKQYSVFDAQHGRGFVDTSHISDRKELFYEIKPIVYLNLVLLLFQYLPVLYPKESKFPYYIMLYLEEYFFL